MHFLGKNLRHLRRQSAKTQSEIASLIQKGQTTIGNWENGISEPSLNELLIISNYFDISIDVLLKTDLGGIHIPDSRYQSGVALQYDHTQKVPLAVNEQDNPSKEQDNPSKEQDNLSFVWQAIRNIRAEMEQLQALLPSQKGGEIKAGSHD